MMRKYFGLVVGCLCLLHFGADAAVVRKTATKGQSAVQQGTNVRTRVEATGLYAPECYEAYYGCMDQFCISDNIDGGSCACSDENAKYVAQLEGIKKKLTEAENIRTVEVERIQAGAQADIIFSGTRKYDEAGNVITDGGITQAETKEQKKRDLLALFDDAIYDDEEYEYIEESIADKTGNALYVAADELCRAQMPASCTKDVTLLKQIYARQIVSDCKGFENTIARSQLAADQELASAQADVRAALKESFEEANRYDRGTCMVEFRKCMQTEDACGADWSKCVSTIASENMQNEKGKSVAGTTVETVVKYDITDSTMEMLDAKRNICEKVLDQCVAVRDMVWPDFLREAAPTIKLAELNVESKMRQSCLTDISDCIQKACKDDIAGKGIATMDSCLSRPDMVRSFCKIQVEQCERMEPLIWNYVGDKLAAMRVDACTAEVKECFMSEDRCGPDFSNCIGMDYNYIHNICPLDKLVVCKANKPGFSMDDLDSMLMGLYLNIDNSALELCQNKIDTKMMEICGSTTDCNFFATGQDEVFGAGSLRSQKDGTTYRVTGMISYGSIKMGDSSARSNARNVRDDKKKLLPGEIGVADYIAQIRELNKNVPNAESIIAIIEEELNNVAGSINRTIQLIEQDPEIQYCVNGRDLTQITGGKNSTFIAGNRTNMTKGRFPYLLDQYKMLIAMSALRRAQDNYNTKLSVEIANATHDASADLAQYMCQKIAETGGSAALGSLGANTPLSTPYAISYDVGSGLTTEDLMKGGQGVISTGGLTVKSGAGAGGGGNESGMAKETTAIFNRADRICHICTTVTTQSCKTSKKGGFLGIGKKSSTSCDTKTLEPDCQDIQM
ncbi:hypothetical protein LJC18_00065 [Lachnospiraceae bacterium OttesenSCG-928-E19]|nr:hypothetical protein [Lachnospiraceae bacterium OttesenSCG-928-E19]